ncbi:MAG: calcium/sodium antiporter [Clostridia bacterium]|nr:calcium/sodium antiporter [Clostridia bacterium]
MVGKALLEVLFLIIGFVLLLKGADFLVDGASGIAMKLKVSAFIVGVTVVAFCTSAPELAVSITAGVTGDGDIIIGNVLGSNIVNVLLILGLSAVITRLPVETSTRFIDVPFLIIVSVLFIVLGYIGWSFAWWEGLILVILYIAFMVYNVLLARRQHRNPQPEELPLHEHRRRTRKRARVVQKEGRFTAWYNGMCQHVWFLIVLTVLGLACVAVGGIFVVDTAEFLAEDVFNIPSEIVALTIVALGTSLPELVTSVVAARKGNVGLATGNIIGSNIANILLIGGVGALASAGSVLSFSYEGIVSGLVGLAAALIIFFSSFTKDREAGGRHYIGRVAGIIMLCCFVAYYTYLFLNLYIFQLY